MLANKSHFSDHNTSTNQETAGTCDISQNLYVVYS